MNALLAPSVAALLVWLVAVRRRPSSARLPTAAEPTDGAVSRRDPFEARRLRRHERRVPSALGVAAWCDDLTRQLRSGSTLRDSLTILPDEPATRRATDLVRRHLDRGVSVVEAVDVPGDGAHLRLALTVILTSARLGGSAAPAIDRTAATLRQRAADADERSVHAAQARLSAHVLTAVPVFMLALLMIGDADVRSAAMSTTGVVCIGVGMMLNVIGWIWMRRIIGTRP